MQNKSTLLLAVLALVVAVSAWWQTGQLQTQTPKTEKASEVFAAYERVLANNEIVCGVYVWPPYVSYDPATKTFSGMTIELIEAMFSTLDLKVKFKEVLLGTQVQDLKTGRVDALCTDGPWSMSAGKFVEFSDPYLYNAVFPYVRNNDDRFQKRADLNKPDVKFTGIDGDLSVDLVQRLFPQAGMLSMGNTTDVSQLYMNVLTKKADVAIVDPGTFEKFNAKNPDQIKVLFPDKPLGVYKGVISVNKGDLKMLGLVNQAVDNGLAFGLIDDIVNRYDPDKKLFVRVHPRYQTQ